MQLYQMGFKDFEINHKILKDGNWDVDTILEFLIEPDIRRVAFGESVYSYIQ